MSQTIYIGLPEVLKICVMGTICKDLTGEPVEFIPPRNIRVMDFLAQVGFYRDLFRWGTLPKGPLSAVQNLLATGYDEPSEFLLPVTKIKREGDVRDATSYLNTRNNIEKLLRHAWAAKRHEDELEYAVSEMAGTLVGEIGENICLHSMSTGYIAVQSQRSDCSSINSGNPNPNVVVAISDGGIGIVRSLRQKDPKKYGPKGATQIIEMVINGDVPKKTGEDRGGIKRAHDLVRDLFHGELHINTSFTEYSKWYNRASSMEFKTDRDESFFVGTHVLMKLPRFGGTATQ